MDIIDAISDQNLFRPLFKDVKTWGAWLVFLKTLFGLSMGKMERSIYHQATGRQVAPKAPFREAWVVAGRRSGKSFTAALVGTFLGTFKDYRPHLAPGERAVILVLAADRSQAQVIFRYVRGFLAATPMLARLVEAERAESIDLVNRVTIQVGTCSFRSIRGLTLAAAVCDEISFWPSDDGSNPATEVLRAVRPALATLPGSLLLAISSPYSRTGPLYEAHRAHYGKDSDTLIWQAPTRLMNPSLDQGLIDRALEADPQAARAEWLAEFRDDISSFLDLETIESLIIPGRRELPPVAGAHYRAFCDPSGGRQDSFTLAISHRERDRVILDVVRRRQPPFNPGDVVAEFCRVLREYGVREAHGDRYSAEWCASTFRDNGVRYVNSERDRSQIFVEALPLFTRGQVELLDDKVLKAELRGLERKTRPQGRDLITHGPGGHDDVANAACGALVLVGGAARPQIRVRWIA
jgi:hypothetical protein